MSLLEAYPVTETCTGWGRAWTVSQFTIADLVALEAYALSRTPHPLVAARAELAGLEGAERRALANRLSLAAGDWPPAWDSPRAEELYETPGGFAFWLYRLLAKHDQEFYEVTPGGEPAAVSRRITPAECFELARSPGLTHAEWLAFRRAAYDLQPDAELARLLDERDPPAGDPPRYADLVDSVCREHGWTLEYVATLTLSQFSLACSGSSRKRGAAAEDWSDLPYEELVRRLIERRAAEALEGPEGPWEGGDGDGR